MTFFRCNAHLIKSEHFHLSYKSDPVQFRSAFVLYENMWNQKVAFCVSVRCTIGVSDSSLHLPIKVLF